MVSWRKQTQESHTPSSCPSVPEILGLRAKCVVYCNDDDGDNNNEPNFSSAELIELKPVCKKNLQLSGFQVRN